VITTYDPDYVDLTDRGRGFGPIDPPPGFPGGAKTELLMAVEQLFKPRVNPKRDNSYIAAVRKLALYGCGKETLSKAEFQANYALADEYEGIMRAPVHGHASNAAMARFVLACAQERLEKESSGSITG
jgi:hypothetical protein